MTYDAPVVLRIALVVLAAAAIGVLATRLRDHDRCAAAQAAVPPRVGELAASCRDPDVLAGVSPTLLVAGRPDQALSLARESVRRAPDSFIAWVALGFALRDRDPAGSRRALARAKELNPRWQGLQ